MAILIKFSVIFIDFNYQGKPGDKALRSLDQVSYQGTSRARSSLKDSYGNPIQYDNLEQIDAKKPSNNKNDPNKFIIPGYAIPAYASGILQPHELPTRSNVNEETSRKIDDDRVHFIDPLQNAYANSDKPVSVPSPSLSTPIGTQDEAANNQIPIFIPKPNLDLPETPQTPIDDPLNHELNPPSDGSTVTPQSTPETPSFSLETPKGNGQNSQQIPLTQDLIPPQIPTEGQSVFIPRPNIDVSETPIDDDFNALLNQGLLPPSDTPAGFGPDSADANTPSTKINDNSCPQCGLPTVPDPTQNGPVIIPEGQVHFAPKPSNGLLPPKDPSPNEINFQPNDPQLNAPQPTFASPDKFTGSFGPSGIPGQGSQPTAATPNKYTGSFGGSPGVLGQTNVNNAPPKDIQPTVAAPNKYTGSFGAPPGVLGQPGLPNRISSQTQIPVQVLTPNKFNGPFGGSQAGTGPAINQIPVAIFIDPTGNSKPPQRQPAPTQTIFTQPPKPSSVVNKYQGGFGGSQGILVSNNQYDRITPVQAQPPASIAPAVPTFATSLAEKFGPDDTSSSTLNQAPTTQTLSQLPNLNNFYPASPKENVVQKYTGTFGGSPGILSPYDNSKN